MGSSDIFTKYPTEHEWSFWIDQYPGPNKMPEEYAKSQKCVGKFKDIQNMWRWVNSFPPASLPYGYSYTIMKENIRPLWEDSNNKDGMTFSIRVNYKDLDDNIINLIWWNLIASVVGESLSFTDNINGISISFRDSNVVFNIWNASANQKYIHQIEKELVPILQELTTETLNLFTKRHDPSALKFRYVKTHSSKSLYMPSY